MSIGPVVVARLTRLARLVEGAAAYGDDGDGGDDGHDGEPGENCPEYALMISLEKIHDDGCRTYKLEHSGQGEKDVHFLKIHPDKDLILVNARGGMGGNG